MATTVKAELERHLRDILAHASMAGLMVLVGDLARKQPQELTAVEAGRCLEAVKLALRVYCRDAAAAERAVHRIGMALRPSAAAPAGSTAIPPAAAPPPATPKVVWGSAPAAERAPARAAAPAALVPARLPEPAEVQVRNFDDAMEVRVLSKEVARRIGFSETMSVRIATAVSELARNIVFYAGSGTVRLEPAGPPAFPRVQMKIVAADQGPGIANLEEIFSGNYKSERGLGMGLIAVKRLMDDFHIHTMPGRGTVVTALKRL